MTIEYHDGHPLGMLLGAIDPDGETAPNAESSFAEPVGIGLQATIKPTTSGTLYLRVNDSAGQLDDNRGTLDRHDRGQYVEMSSGESRDDTSPAL